MEAPSAAEGACSPPGSVRSVRVNHQAKPGEWFMARSRCAPLSGISLKMKHGRKITHTNISDVTW